MTARLLPAGSRRWSCTITNSGADVRKTAAVGWAAPALNPTWFAGQDTLLQFRPPQTGCLRVDRRVGWASMTRPEPRRYQAVYARPSFGRTQAASCLIAWSP